MKMLMNETTFSYFFNDLGSLLKPLFIETDNVWEVLGTKLVAFVETNLQKKIEGTIITGAFLDENVQIGAGTVVEPGVYIKGPTIIGRNCEIRHGAYIRGGVIIGDDCVVGHATEVKNSVFLSGAKAGHFAYVGDSILGAGVNLGAGTKLANLKIIPGTVRIRVLGQLFDTGLRKFGAILGDGVETGCNSVTSPGTMLGPKTLVYPCVNARGFHQAESIVK